MKQLLTTLTIVLISSSLFISCSNTASESGTNTAAETKSGFDLAEAKKAIDSANAQFQAFVAKSDSVGITTLYHTDAKILGQNAPIASGKAAIQRSFAEMMNMGIGGATLTSSEVYGNEEIISEVGTYSLTDKAGKEMDKGKYIVLWKMEDGKWKIFRDCYNSDLPPMAPPK